MSVFQTIQQAAASVVFAGATVLTAAALILTLMHLITASSGLDAHSGDTASISKTAAAWLAAGHVIALFLLLGFWSRQL